MTLLILITIICLSVGMTLLATTSFFPEEMNDLAVQMWICSIVIISVVVIFWIGRTSLEWGWL